MTWAHHPHFTEQEREAAGDLPSATRQSLDWNSSVPKATPFPPCQTSLHFRVCRPEAKGWERARLSAGSSERESAGGQEAARKHPPPRPTASEVGEHADDERRLVTGEGSGEPPGLGARDGRDGRSGREGPAVALKFSASSSPPEELKPKSLRPCHFRTFAAASEGNAPISPASPPSAKLLTPGE